MFSLAVTALIPISIMSVFAVRPLCQQAGKLNPFLGRWSRVHKLVDWKRWRSKDRRHLEVDLTDRRLLRSATNPGNCGTALNVLDGFCVCEFLHEPSGGVGCRSSFGHRPKPKIFRPISLSTRARGTNAGGLSF